MKYTVTIENDQDTENPTSLDGRWKIYSFSTRHASYRSPDDFFGDNGRPHLWLQNKLRVGLAHVLSYHEHGNCVWSLQGHGPQCPWDSVDVAGLAIWEEKPSHMGAKTYEDRAADCEKFLECYTDWCNGACYYYRIERIGKACVACGAMTEEGSEDIASCGGFIGEEHLAECLQEAMPEDATSDNTELEGDAAWIADYNDIFPAKK